MYPLVHQTKYIHMWKTNFTSYKQYFCSLYFTRNVKGIIQNKVHYIFLVVFLKRNNSQAFKCTKLFSSVHVIGITFFDESFSFYVTTWRHYFLSNVYWYSKDFSNRHVAMLFEKSVLRKVCTLHYLHSTLTVHNADTKVKKKGFYFPNFLN